MSLRASAPPKADKLAGFVWLGNSPEGGAGETVLVTPVFRRFGVGKVDRYRPGLIGPIPSSGCLSHRLLRPEQLTGPPIESPLFARMGVGGVL